MVTVDFSYLDNALRTTLDDESTMELYTSAFINDDIFSLIFFGDEQFDDLTDDMLLDQMRKFASKKQTLKLLKKKSADDFRFHLYRYRKNSATDIAKFVDELNRIIICQPLSKDVSYLEEKGLSSAFVEYETWNGDQYDDILKILIVLAGRKLKEKLTPSYIRFLSNCIIAFDDREYKFGKYIEEKTEGLITANAYKLQRNLSRWADGHIDWAKIAASNDNGEESKFPPGLKKEMARYGFDIIFDETVTSDEKRIWTYQEKLNLVEYNFNDVLGTKKIGQNSFLVGRLRTRDIVRKMYPYSSARATAFDKLHKYEPAARDATAASIASLVLIGPKRIKPVDYETVQYTFPVPDKKGGEKTVDLLDYINETEAFVHPFFNQFFGHFRGKDSRSSYDNWKLKLAQPVTHQGQMNLPYFKDGKPIDAYARLSTGGAHGATCAGIHLMSEAELETWIRKDIGETDASKATVDKKNVIHIDWSSFYPTMASKMQLYKTAEGIDRYTNIINYRLEIKDRATALFHAGKEDSQEYIDTQETQDGLKFIMNSATGAGNMHNPYALLPVDNKTLSMRLIGNMHIYTLGQRLAQAGAFIIATNTDGIFICNLDMETVKEIVNGYIDDYGMGVDPEFMERFINRDTSNRIELEKDATKVSKIGGTMRHAKNLTFNPGSFGRNVTYPLVAASAAIAYMVEKEDWLQTPYDPAFIRDYLEDVKKHTKTVDDMQAWFHVHVGSSARLFTLNGVRQQKVNRVVLTKDGDLIGGEDLRQFSKDVAKQFWNMKIKDEIDFLKDLKFKDLPKYELEKALIDKNIDDVDIAFVKKSIDDQTAEEIYEPIHLGDNYLFELRDATGLSKSDPQLYQEIVQNQNRDKLILDSIGTSILGWSLKGQNKWQPIKVWKPSKKLTGYPSNVAAVLNTRQALEDFDIEQLDLEAYAKWAESILESWKVSADIPALNMVSIDDSVSKLKKRARLSKKDVAIEQLKQFYNSAVTIA